MSKIPNDAYFNITTNLWYNIIGGNTNDEREKEGRVIRVG